MTHQHLIFIDGIPGAGKTTTARWLAEQLRQAGVRAVAHLEMDDPHPLHAFWTWGDGYRPDDVVTEPFSAGKFTERLNAKAESLVRHVLAESRPAVVEAYPFQLPVRNHLKMGASRAQLEAFFDSFQRTITPAKPLLVFIGRPDMRATFGSAIRERGAWFEEIFIHSITRSPYGRRHGLEGFDGALAFYQACYELVEELLTKWRFEVCRVNPARDGWDAARAQMLSATENLSSGTETHSKE